VQANKNQQDLQARRRLQDELRRAQNQITAE
jgi:hypothetical protein